MSDRQIRMTIHGMSCGSCKAHVQKALQQIAGVSGVAVDVAKGEAVVTPEGAGPEHTDLITAVEQAGYRVSAIEPARGG